MDNEKIYKPRLLDSVLQEELEAMGIVLIEGSKACGKTTTAEHAAKSAIFMDDPEQREQYAQLAETNIKLILNGETPRLIDEWQLVPRIWDAVRFEVDHRRKDGQFILTGSAVPSQKAHEEMWHSGTGRVSWLKMRPMSLWESEESTGEISLQTLFNSKDGNQTIEGQNSLTLEEIAFLCCRGGWPRAAEKGLKQVALRHAANYYEGIVRSDISRVDNVERSEVRTRYIMRSFSRHIGTQIGARMILEDIRSNDSNETSERTVLSYINALKSIFVIEDMPAWNPNLRSKSAIRTVDTRYYVDPSVACASLNVSPDDLLNDLNTLGLVFENLCVRDLRVYAQILNGNVYHYRDSTGLECDAVVHLKNSKYGLIEIKLGGDTLIEEGARSLLKLKGKIDTTRMKAPAFLMVLTAVGSYAYKRNDGVFVVPVGCLKP